MNTDDRALCWAQNFFGEVGDGTTTMRLKPVKVLGTLAFAQLGTGQGWTCGTTTAGVGYCWEPTPLVRSATTLRSIATSRRDRGTHLNGGREAGGQGAVPSPTS